MIALITAWDEKYASLGEVARPLIERYCARHGYDAFIGEYHTNPANLQTYGDRLKVEMYNRRYADGYDMVCWLDIDVIVMNSEIRIEDVVGRYQVGYGLAFTTEPRRFTWSHDSNGPLSGFWIARCVPEVRNFLNQAVQKSLEMTSTIVRIGTEPATVTTQFEPYGVSDQTGMRAIMHMPPHRDVAQHCLPGKDVGHCYEPGRDPYMDYEPGKWLITFPGLPLDVRLAKMKEWARLAV